ncbi:MAG: SIR2 family protein, partial [Gammaproteobacteria bacterium]
MEATKWLSVDSLINDLRSRTDYAILCGAGISRDAGLLTGKDFRDLVCQFAPDFKGELLLAELLTRSAAMLPPLRFEGVLEVLQRTVDHELNILNVYRKGTPICIHRALAKIARLCPVLTTNLDVLIERAEVAAGFPCQVYFEDADFSTYPSSKDDLRGLWKLHGTLSRWIGGREHPLQATDPGFPVATLKSLSASRESTSRKALLAHVLRQHDVMIVGYSGADDFDVSRWLIRREFDETSETKPPAPTKALIWLQYTSDAGDPRLIPGSKILTDASGRLDSGLMKLILHWNQKGWLSQLYVILHNQPVHFVTALVDEPCPEHAPLPASSVRGPSSSEWTQQLVTGCLLSSLALYQEALPFLNQAVTASDPGHAKGLSLIALAAAKLEIGDRVLRNQALEHAKAAQHELQSPPPEWQSLYYRAQFVAATAARLAGSEDPEGHINTLLKAFQVCRDKESQDASLSELAADILVELRRSRRHVRREPAGSTAQSAAYEPFTQEEYLDYVTKNGLLKAKGLDLHERARAEWEAAGSPDDLQQVLRVMQSAAELRRDLGDIRGLCESLVLCGHLSLRQCDWPGEDIKPTDIV